MHKKHDIISTAKQKMHIRRRTFQLLFAKYNLNDYFACEEGGGPVGHGDLFAS